MNKIVLLIAPEYLSFYISGAWDVMVPLQVNKLGILANHECIRVPCLYWNDGDTQVTFGDIIEVTPGGPPDFDDLLETSTQEVILTDANGTEYAKASVPDLLTRVRIWINHPTEPDKVVIGLG